MDDLEQQARRAYQQTNVNGMINQSIDVLTNPSIATFEKYEKIGKTQEALIYVGLASVIAGVLSFLATLIWLGLGWAFSALISGIIGTILGFAVFALAIFYIGKSQGGTGTQDEVFYTASLIAAPLQALGGVVTALIAVFPPLACLALPASLVIAVYQAYLGYLMTRSSMNLEKNPAIITVVLAVVATWVVSAVVGSIF